MSDELITWLRAQLDDDERVAREATPGPWESQWWGVRTAYEFDRPGYIHHGERVTVATNSGTVGNREAEIRNAEHIARWDPARVLAEIEAKRRILDEHDPTPTTKTCCPTCYDAYGQEPVPAPCPTVRLLALPYAGRDGWHDERFLDAN